MRREVSGVISWAQVYPTATVRARFGDISVVGSCADVGKALGAWISTIADAIALIWGKIGDLAVLLGKFFKDQKTQAAMNWELLVAGFDGMPENKWPIITETTSDTMDNPANWP